MYQEKYNLKWDTYSDHLKGMMKELMTNEDFSDVTLVTEDKKQIRANINILRTCSPVFKEIFTKERYSNQIMYLRGVQYSELESIMQYIYLGEATLYKERMDEFLAIAKSLEIKELCIAITEMDEGPQCDMEKLAEKFDVQPPKPDHDNNQALQKQILLACNQCDYQFTNQYNLSRHIQSKHMGVKYACNQCDYQAKKQSHLTTHIQSIHEGVRYPCNQCDYQATQKLKLAAHIQSKHEGVKYSCDQCDTKFDHRFSLTRHIRNMH